MAQDASKAARDQIRAHIFGRKVRSKVVTLVAEDGSKNDVEVRQPLVGATLDMATEESAKKRMLSLLVEHCFVPGTQVKVFEAADLEGISNLPSSGDYDKLVGAINDLMDLDKAIKAQSKN
jgi:hypothetical protein